MANHQNTPGQPPPLPPLPPPPASKHTISPYAATEVPGQTYGAMTGSGASPLSPQQMWEWAEANKRAKRIRAAYIYAMFDGISVAVFALLTLLLGYFSWVGIIMGLGMAMVAAVELWAARRLKQFVPKSALVLGWNQLAFALLLIVYAAGSAISFLQGGGSELQKLISQDPRLTGLDPAVDIAQLIRLMVLLVYGGVILVAFFVQGGTAIFYFTREKHVRAHLDQTPPWVQEMLRMGAVPPFRH